MKKTITLMILLIMAMVVKAQTEPVTTTYDFEDGNAMFVGRSRITVGVEDTLGYDNTKAVYFTCAHNAQNGYSFANFDISSLVGDPKTVAISLQYYNNNGGRAILSIGDASVRGTTGNSSKGTYSNKGAIFALGSNKDNALINGVKNSKSTYCNKWLDVNVTVNVIEKTYSYSIKEAGADAVLASGENVEYYSSEALACTQIDLFGYINNNKCAYIDNLTITATPDDRPFADYIVSYVDEAGNTLKESVTYSDRVGDAVILTESDKASFKNSDNTKKYIYKSDDAAGKTIADDGSTVVKVTFREAETWNYTVNAVDEDGNVLEELATGSNLESEAISAYYGRYIFKEGVLYEKAANNSEYSQKFDLTSNNMTANVVYNKSAVTNAVYFSEAEDIEVITKYEDEYTRIRLSKGAAGYASELTTIATLPAGIYTLTSATRDGTAKFYAASDSVFAITSSGSVVTATSGEFTVYEPTEIKVAAGSRSNYFDYLLICRTGDAPELVIDDTNGLAAGFSPEYSSYASVVYKRELNIDYNGSKLKYGLICLPFVPDAKSLENFQFYTLTGADGESVTFTEVDDAALEANTPYLYGVKDGATRTDSITAGYTTFDLENATTVNNTTVEGTNWTLVGSLEDTKVAETTVNYAFSPVGNTLHKVTQELTVYPYSAYICNDVPSTSSLNSLSQMRVFIGTPTGIKEISRDQIAGFGDKAGMFDLQGRALSNPVKGQIYIENGEKKIKN